MGRTARAGRSGYAVSLVNQYEAQWFVLIEKLLGNYNFFSPFFFLTIDSHSWRCHFYKACLSYQLRFAGKQIDQRKVDRDEVMILKGPISDAKRIALTVRPPLKSVSIL